IYSIGCCAFRNARRAETDYQHGENRMSKIRPRWDYHWVELNSTIDSKMVSEPPPRFDELSAIRFLIEPSTIYIRAPSPIVLGARGVLRSITSIAR
ncbi:tetraspanin-6-like, partial [Trifolium medium]|nr:tetraspanin-6-like [Trifolium medium]